MAGPWEKYKRPVDPTGNPIDTARPRIENPDGSFSTEKTIGIEMDGRYYNIPTIVNGQQLTDDQAVEAFRSGTNKAVGEFTSQAEADAAAAPRSSTIGQVRGPWEKYQPQQVPAPSGPAPTATAAPAVTPPAAPADGPANLWGWYPEDRKSSDFAAQQTLGGIVADTVGLPGDVVEMGVNSQLWGADKIAELFGGNLDTRVNLPGSDTMAELGSRGFEAIGGHVVAPEEVSDNMRLIGAALRFGGGALAGAGGAATKFARESAEQAPSFLKRFLLDPMTRPYTSEPGKAVARDVLTGAGAGVGYEGFDQYAPDAVQESSWGPIAQVLAGVAGGLGARAPIALAEGTVSQGTRIGQNVFMGPGDPNAPINPLTQVPFRRQEMDMAARIAQAIPSDKGNAIENVKNRKAEFASFATPNEAPTVGMMADDIGVALQENKLRVQDSQRFAERDAARVSKADSLLDKSAPAGADGRAFTGEAVRQYDDTLDSARQSVDDATAREAAAKADLQKQNADLEGYRAGQPQVSSALAEDFDLARRSAREQKNALYDAADPKTPVDGRFLDEAVTRIDADMADAEKMVDGPYAQIAQRVKSLVQQVDPETGDVTVKDVTYADIKALRAQVSEARKNAVAASGQSVAGSGADVRRLDQLGAVLNKLSDDINPEAARFYREEYAPRFKQGRAGEYGAARDRANATGNESSATRPSEFGEKFLKRPEDAASLKRVFAQPPSGQPQIPGPAGSANAPTSGLDPKIEQNAKEWMLGDLAKSGVLTDNAEIRFDKFKQWTDKNRATIDQFPDIAKTVNAELSRAQQGGMLSKQLAADVAAAKAGMKTTEQELRRSALQSAVGNNPENAVAGIMGSGDPETRMSEMVRRLSGKRDAIDGLKAAVRDWIRSSTATTTPVVGYPEAMRLGPAGLQKLFTRHEKTLAKIYTPEEMNALRQSHRLLSAETTLRTMSSSGSNTVDKMMAQAKTVTEQRKRIIEAAFKAKFGNLTGGGYNRTLNVFLSALPNNDQAIEDVLYAMHFDPELAIHLWTRPLKDIGTPKWSMRLNQLLSAATAARDANAEKPEPQQ